MPAGLTLAFQLQRRPCPVTAGPKRQSAQNQDGKLPGYGLQARLGALVHAIGNGAARPAMLNVQAPSASGAPQVRHYCRHWQLLSHEAVERLAKASCNLRTFVSIHDREFRFSYFPVIFVWEAPIETRILDRYSNTGAKVRVKCIYNVTVAGEEFPSAEGNDLPFPPTISASMPSGIWVMT